MTKNELLELIRAEMQSLMAEWDRDNPDDDPSDDSTNRMNRRRYGIDAVKKSSTTQKSATGSRDGMLSQKVKYKNADGSDGEGTVKSLLRYAKDHPGRKAAARIYAQHMAKQKKEENITNLDERTVARREPPRKMNKKQVTKRDKVGKSLLKNKRSVRYFKDKFGDDWKSYLYATATNKAIAGKKKK